MAAFPLFRIPCLILALSGLAFPADRVASAFVRLAAVWDAGEAADARRRVQTRVKAWSPELVIDFGAGRLPAGGARGPVHLFVLDGASASEEEGGEAAAALRLKEALGSSTAPWKIVCIPDAPYTRGDGRGEAFRWPLKEWGADAVLAGHDRRYERLEIDGLACFAGGAGGEASGSEIGSLPGSRCVYEEEQGALLIEAGPARVDFRYVTSEGVVVDAHSLRKPVLAGSPATEAPAGTRGGAKAVKASAAVPSGR
jgi:hypothetical protein